MRIGIGSYTFPCQIASGAMDHQGLLDRAIGLGAEVVQYCENRADCRRSQQMAYFGEVFDPVDCKKFSKAICDNCASTVCGAAMPYFSHA